MKNNIHRIFAGLLAMTVIRDNGETVFQYEGDLDIWKGADGKAYGIIYLDEEVLQ